MEPTVRAALHSRWERRFCPYLMALCPQAVPVCGVIRDAGLLPICRHRFLEDGKVFRAVASWLAGPRPAALHHFHPRGYGPALDWVLFDERHPDRWIGIAALAPRPLSAEGLRHALHHALRDGAVPEDFDDGLGWPESARDAVGWLRDAEGLAEACRRPILVLLPQELHERVAAYADGQGASFPHLSLVPVAFPWRDGRFTMKVPDLSVPPDPETDRESLARIARRRGEWILVEALARIKVEA